MHIFLFRSIKPGEFHAARNSPSFEKLGYEFSIMLKIKGKRPLVIPNYESVALDIDTHSWN